MGESVGGSMAAMMAAGDELVDSWIAHAQQTGASTPELVAHLMLTMDQTPNKAGVFAVMAATAIQRIVG